MQLTQADFDRFEKNPIVPQTDVHEDERGAIIPLADVDMKSAVLITSLKNTIRANHYHLTDWHYCYMISGEMQYFWRKTHTTGTIHQITIKAGDNFFTPPMVDHAMVFTKDSSFVCLGKNSRTQESYESDVRRVELVRPTIFQEL